MKRYAVVDGKSNFFLDQYPEQAWTQLTPSAGDMANSRDALDAIGKYYENVAFLHRCVALRADALLRVPWAIVRNGDDVWNSDEPTPPEMLRQFRDIRRLLRLTEMALCLSPEAFWFRERNQTRTLAYRWHAPSSVVPQWSATQGLTGFKRLLGNGHTAMFDVDDYVYFSLPNPLHETMPGRPPGQAAMAAAGVLYNMDAFSSSFFSRGAIKATLLTVDGSPSPGELQKLETWWRRAFTGITQAWQTAAVRAGVTPVVIGEGIESLSKSTLTREHKEDIATALGIPHSLVLSDAVNRSVAETDNLHFYDKTIIPAFEMLAETLNEQAFYPLGLRMELRPQRMSIYQEDEEQRSMSVLHYTQANVPVEIAMQMLGVNLPDGMDYEQFGALMQRQRMASSPATPPSASVALPSAPVEMDITTAAADLEAISGDLERLAEIKRLRLWAKRRAHPDSTRFYSDILSDAEKRSIVREVSGVKGLTLQLDPDDEEAEQKRRMGIEREAAANIERALGIQARRIEEIARRFDPGEFADWAALDLAEAFTRARDEYDLYEALRAALNESVDLGVRVAVEQFDNIGYTFDWTLANERARQWVNEYTFKLVEGINSTSLDRTRSALGAWMSGNETLDMTRAAIADWIASGETLDALIGEMATIFGPDRARLIASTEVTRAYAEANQRAYIESGVVDRIEFRNSADERVCPVCGPRGGTTSDVRNPSFDGYGLPPLHPGCRCWIVAVVEEPRAR